MTRQDTFSRLRLTSRYVSDCGETLVVRDHFGVKVLADPADDTVTVFVPVGRRANLVRFTFGEPGRSCNRDAHVIVIKSDRHIGFAWVRHLASRVFLQDLSEGQLVDVLPAAEPAVAYAAIPRPLPVLYGAVAVQPVYAAVAA